MEAKADLLHKTDRRLAEVYATRSGRDVDSFVALMNENSGNGRWLSPEEVVDAALADVVINDYATTSTERRSVAAAITDKWTKMLDKLGLAERDKMQMPSDRNVFHFDTPPMVEDIKPAPSVIQFHEGQRRVAPTTIRSKEDPSINGDIYRTPNESAYAADVRSLSRF
jgi:hypothetical protein